MDNPNNDNNNDRNRAPSWWAVSAAAAAIGLGAYFVTRRGEPQTQRRPIVVTAGDGSDNDDSSYLSNMVSRMLVTPQVRDVQGRYSPELESQSVPVISNLTALLNDIYNRYVRLKEFREHYHVFNTIFHELHESMKETNAYYRKYSSTVQFSGSHYDRLRIKKPDEFDVNIVIDLPLNMRVDRFNPNQSDINFEAVSPGYVQLKTGVQFEKLPFRDDWENNRDAFRWRDSDKYLLRSKFLYWFEGVVMKALNKFKTGILSKPVIYVDNVPYTIGRSGSGPAVTLKIYNTNFYMDVDLVPSLRFSEDRWPINSDYRDIPPQCRRGYFMVIPKRNKQTEYIFERDRSWRLVLLVQERVLFENTNNLRQTMRLMKKMRDALHLDKIVSYYIKNLFFWEVIAIGDKHYWSNSTGILFKRMVGRLHEALVAGKIAYFWNERENLIGSISRSTLTQYANQLVPLIKILDDPTKYKQVAKFLLTRDEFKSYNENYLFI